MEHKLRGKGLLPWASRRTEWNVFPPSMDMGKCLSSKLGYCVNLSSGMFANDLSLVIQLPGGRLYISGVALLGYWNICDIRVPRDPNELFLGNPEISSKGLQKADPTCRHYYYYCPEPRAFLMHERCWTLMTRILDIGLIEKHLDLFLTILTEKVDHAKSGVECLVLEIDYFVLTSGLYGRTFLSRSDRLWNAAHWTI